MSENREETSSKPYRLPILSPEVVESLRRFSEHMTKAVDSMQHLQQHLVDTAKFIPPIVPPALPEYMRRLGQYLEGSNISTAFTECGLWIAPSMTLHLVKEVVERYEQGRKRTVPAIVDGFYRQSNWQILTDAVRGWASYEFFTPRMSIFYDALDAHIGRKWTLTIPALIPHIEGIAGEILLANKLTLSKEAIIVAQGQKTYPSSVFGKLRAGDVTPTMDVMISSLLYYLEGTLYEYKDFRCYPKTRRLEKLNRHAIAHGYQLNYATRLNSLRCFLALDSLSMLKGNIPKLV